MQLKSADSKQTQFQVQDSDLEYLIWQFDKRIILSEKKPPLVFWGLYGLVFYLETIRVR